MEFPILHTERLDLIEIGDHHLNDLFLLFGDERVTRFYNIKTYNSPADGQEFIDWYKKRFEENLSIRWGITFKGNSRIIGTIGFNNFTRNHRASVGYDLQQIYWNRGYVTEALKAVIKYGFTEMDINRIEAEVFPGNHASEIVLNKAGFTREGILKQWLYWNNNYYDMIMYALLKKDYRTYR